MTMTADFTTVADPQLAHAANFGDAVLTLKPGDGAVRTDDISAWLKQNVPTGSTVDFKVVTHCWSTRHGQPQGFHRVYRGSFCNDVHMDAYDHYQQPTVVSSGYKTLNDIAIFMTTSPHGQWFSSIVLHVTSSR